MHGKVTLSRVTELEVLARKYREFLDHGKTERVFVDRRTGKSSWHRDLEEVIAAEIV